MFTRLAIAAIAAFSASVQDAPAVSVEILDLATGPAQIHRMVLVGGAEWAYVPVGQFERDRDRARPLPFELSSFAHEVETVFVCDETGLCICKPEEDDQVFAYVDYFGILDTGSRQAGLYGQGELGASRGGLRPGGLGGNAFGGTNRIGMDRGVSDTGGFGVQIKDTVIYEVVLEIGDEGNGIPWLPLTDGEDGLIDVTDNSSSGGDWGERPDVEIAATPLPLSGLLLVAGVGALAALRRRAAA